MVVIFFVSSLKNKVALFGKAADCGFVPGREFRYGKLTGFVNLISIPVHVGGPVCTKNFGKNEVDEANAVIVTNVCARIA
jgi:hypothetical protein